MKDTASKTPEFSGANANSVREYRRALRELQCFVADPVATVDAAIAESPEFVMAHVLKAYLHLLGTDPNDVAVANTCLETAQRCRASAREQAHQAAACHLVNGRWHSAGRVLEDVAVERPRDILALQVGHQIDFFTGNSRMLRDRIARALPRWEDGMDGYHAVLGMYAFGLEECGAYADAERFGRAAIERNSRDGWAQHAVAHVMEMGNRPRDGILWMEANRSDWAGNSFFQVHNWWHLALFYLEVGETSEVLRLFDGPIFGNRSGLVLDMVDASSLLWRLTLLGISVGDRWQALAENWSATGSGGHYAFNDFHAAMAYVGAGRADKLEDILEAQQSAVSGTNDNAMFTRDVGRPLVLGLKAFAAEDYAATVEKFRDVREIAHRFGGSHAQRDLIDLTLIASAVKSGQRKLATALLAERTASRPESPMTGLLRRRAASSAMAA
jgi:hypothetical protein